MQEKKSSGLVHLKIPLLVCDMQTVGRLLEVSWRRGSVCLVCSVISSCIHYQQLQEAGLDGNVLRLGMAALTNCLRQTLGHTKRTQIFSCHNSWYKNITILLLFGRNGWGQPFTSCQALRAALTPVQQLYSWWSWVESWEALVRVSCPLFTQDLVLISDSGSLDLNQCCSCITAMPMPCCGPYWCIHGPWPMKVLCSLAPDLLHQPWTCLVTWAPGCAQRPPSLLPCTLHGGSGMGPVWQGHAPPAHGCTMAHSFPSLSFLSHFFAAPHQCL